MEQDSKQPAEPELRKHPDVSLVWLIPLITLAIGGWLIFKTISEQGPLISITFDTAAGIEAGTTRIRYKDVEIGVVEKLQFTEGHQQIVVSAKMNRNAENLTAKMMEINHEKRLVRRPPSVKVVSGWITQAKNLAPKVEY